MEIFNFAPARSILLVILERENKRAKERITNRELGHKCISDSHSNQNFKVDILQQAISGIVGSSE